MRSNPVVRSGLAAAVIMLVPSAAQAQGIESEIRLDQLVPASAGSPFIRAEGPFESFDKGIAFGFRFDTDYQYAPVRSRIPAFGDEELLPVAHALLLHTGASLSPVDWLLLELSFPAAVYESGEPDARLPQQPVAAGQAGQGDVRIGAHVRPLDAKAYDVQVGLRFWAPTGSSDAYLNGDSGFLRLELVPAIAGEIDFVRYGCTLGIAPLFFAGRDGDRLAASCAAHLEVLPILDVGLEPHFALFSFSRGAQISEHTPGLGEAAIGTAFEPLAVVRADIGDFSVALSGGPGIGTAPGTPKARLALTLGYAAKGERVVEEQVEDRDLDGIEDARDACPEAAGTEARDGCPEERDLDGDGILEGDACPEEAGASYDDPEAHGCPDTDHDDLADPVDACPAEPGSDDEGCPMFARLKDGDFSIEPPVKFVPQQARLSRDGHAALSEVIRTVRTNPEVERVKISVGSKYTYKKLTQVRIQAILELLGAEDATRDRFEVVADDELASGDVEIHVAK